MRCGCPDCGRYMAQAQKGLDSRCVCPECGYECRDCMGGEERFPEKIEKGKGVPETVRRRFEEIIGGEQ